MTKLKNVREREWLQFEARMRHMRRAPVGSGWKRHPVIMSRSRLRKCPYWKSKPTEEFLAFWRMLG